MESCPCWERPPGKHTKKIPQCQWPVGSQAFTLLHALLLFFQTPLRPVRSLPQTCRLRKGVERRLLGAGYKEQSTLLKAQLLLIDCSTSPRGGCLFKAHVALSQGNTPLEDGHYQEQQEVHMCTLSLPLSQRWN